MSSERQILSTSNDSEDNELLESTKRELNNLVAKERERVGVDSEMSLKDLCRFEKEEGIPLFLHGESFTSDIGKLIRPLRSVYGISKLLGIFRVTNYQHNIMSNTIVLLIQYESLLNCSELMIAGIRYLAVDKIMSTKTFETGGSSSLFPRTALSRGIDLTNKLWLSYLLESELEVIHDVVDEEVYKNITGIVLAFDFAKQQTRNFFFVSCLNDNIRTKLIAQVNARVADRSMIKAKKILLFSRGKS